MAYLVALVVGYLIGSIPTAYILARFMKGADIRTIGSGNVGSSNMWQSVSKIGYVATLGFDLLKGAFAILFLRANGYDEVLQMLGGIAAIVGHSWPLWLRFIGGRGIATTGGVLFMFGPVETMWTGILVASGSALKKGPQTVLLSFLLWPLWATLWSQVSLEIVIGSLVVWLLIVVRRLQGSKGLHLTATNENVYWNRLWLDRDIKDTAEWVRLGGGKKRGA
jgi:glycerol-3-phosphate acyltransferase PlsY